jgi:hypothetical protein
VLPQWFRLALISLLALTLIGVILADYRSDGYEAQTLALALVGVVGTALGSDKFRNKGGKGE